MNLSPLHPIRAECATRGIYILRSTIERFYNVQRWTIMAACGHFAAVAEPGLLIDDLRQIFAAERLEVGWPGCTPFVLFNQRTTGCAAREHPQRTAWTMPCIRWNVPARRTEWVGTVQCIRCLCRQRHAAKTVCPGGSNFKVNLARVNSS